MKQTYLLGLLLLFIGSCNAQNKTQPQANEQQVITAKHPKISKKQGSNQYGNVHCGLQDKAGNLWFGTSDEGVYRFDGKSFTQFTVKDGLKSNTILSMLEDKQGTIWFGTANGACLYNGKNITCMQIAVTNNSNLYLYSAPTDNASSKNEVWSMMQDKSGKMWFGTSKGVFCYNGMFFTRFLDNDSIINKDRLHLKMIDCILEDKNGIIWFASGMPPGMEGLCRYDGKSITSFKPNGNGWIRSVLEEKNGNLLITTRSSGVCRYDGKDLTNITEKAGIFNGSIYITLKDKAGNLWFATETGSGEKSEDGGLWRFDGKLFTKFTTKDGLPHNGVSFVMEDKAGNIWAGTRNTGLCRYDGKTFTSFSE